MKTKLMIFLTAFSLSLSAQIVNDSSKLAGLYLMKSADKEQASFLLACAGATTIAMSARSDSELLRYTGFGCLVVSGLLKLDAIADKKRAGVLINEYGFGFRIKMY